MTENEMKLLLHENKHLEKIAKKLIALNVSEKQLEFLKSIANTIDKLCHINIWEGVSNNTILFEELNSTPEELEIWFKLFYLQYELPEKYNSNINELASSFVGEFIKFYKYKNDKGE